MKKKLISLLLVVALVVGLLPATALAADSVVFIGGVGLAAGEYYVNGASAAVATEPANWNAKLESDANGYTLTIRNLSAHGVAGQNHSAAIYSTVSLTLVLEGANSLTGADGTATGNSAGIYVDGALKITGGGALSATGGAAKTGNFVGYGIYAAGGAAAHSVHIENATVTATGGTVALYRYGICGGAPNGDGYNAVYITGADTVVNAVGGDGGTQGFSSGIDTNNANTNGSIKIDGGTVNAVGGTAQRSFGIRFNTKMTVSGGVVNVAGGKAFMSYGVFGRANNKDLDMYVTGGVVNATCADCTTVSGSSTAIGMQANLIISGGVVVAAGGNTNGASSFGVSTATVTGGVLIARAGTSKSNQLAIGEKISGSGTMIYPASDGTASTPLTDAANTPTATSLVVVPDSWKPLTDASDNITLTKNSYRVTTSAEALGISSGTIKINTAEHTLLAVSLSDGSGETYGINTGGVSGKLVVTGTGSVIAVAGISKTADPFGSGSSYGIMSDVENSATIIAVAGTSADKSGIGISGDITNSGRIIALSSAANNSYGINGDVTNNGGTITAIGGTSTVGSYGISGDITNSGMLTAIGGTGANSYGINATTGIANSGTITGIGGTATGGSYGVHSTGEINNESGTINAVAGTATTNSYGAYSGRNLINYGTLTATGGTGKNSYGVVSIGALTNYSSVTAKGGTGTNSYGVVAGSIINGDAKNSTEDNAKASITANGGEAGTSFGIYSDNTSDDSITNYGTLTGNGADNSYNSLGVCTMGGIVNGEGATFSGIAGDATNSVGVYTVALDNGKGATFSGTAGKGTGEGGMCYGVFAGSIENGENASITGIAGDATYRSFGVRGTSLINTGTINGTAGDITGTGDDFASNGIRIIAIDADSNNVSVAKNNTGTLNGTSTGDASDKSYGLYYHGGSTGWLASGEFEGGARAIYTVDNDTTDETEVTVASLVTDDSTYYNKDNTEVEGDPTTETYLRVVPKQHTVTFTVENANVVTGVTYPESQTVDYNGTVTKPTTPETDDIVKDYYRFNGWYTKDSGGEYVPYDFDTAVTENVDLYAVWTSLQAHGLQFDIGLPIRYGRTLDQVVNDYEDAAKLKEPKQDGYRFDGWYTTNSYDTGTEYTSTTPITGVVDIYAKWIKTYNVTFDTNGGSAVTTQTVDVNGYAEKPTDPTLDGYQFAGWYTDEGLTNRWSFNTPITENITLYAKWGSVAYNVTGTVTKHDGTPAANVKVEIKQGNTVFGTATTDERGEYIMEYIPAGEYNIVATEYFESDEGGKIAGRTMTKLVSVKDDTAVGAIVLPEKNVSSKLAVEPGTPDIVVGGLDIEVSDDEHSGAAGDTVNVSISMAIKKQEEQPEEATDEVAEIQQSIKEAASEGDSSERTYTFIDITLTKTVTGEGTTALTKTNNLIQLIVPFDTDGRSNFKVFRSHLGDIHEITEAANEGGEYFETGDGFVTLHVRFFSTYSISSTEATPPAGGDNTTIGGGSGSPSTYPPTIIQPEHGTITVSPSSPQAGDKVTITVTSDDGFNTDKVIVVDRNGNPVSFTDNGDDTYTFEQPRGNVTISAELTPTDEPTDDPTDDHIYCPQDDTCPIAKFDDADPTAWYHDAVHYCIANGLMNGTSDTEFEPHEPTTRAMLVTILHRMAGTPAPTTTGTFTDVPNDMWYTDAIDWAASLGIILGHGDGTFEPDSNLTREQMATILYRCAQLLGVDVSVGEDTNILSFTDADEISDWAYAALQWASGIGLYEGDGDGTLRPADDLERCEMATLIYRLCETILK